MTHYNYEWWLGTAVWCAVLTSAVILITGIMTVNYATGYPSDWNTLERGLIVCQFTDDCDDERYVEHMDARLAEHRAKTDRWSHVLAAAIFATGITWGAVVLIALKFGGDA
jgi:hypothetical protein